MAAATQVSIGQVKRDISDLVNRVAYAHERIVLTSRGKPKAALVSMEDYERLQAAGDTAANWQAWLEEHHRLNAEILERRHGLPIDANAAWEAGRADLEERDGSDRGG